MAQAQLRQGDLAGARETLIKLVKAVVLLAEADIRCTFQDVAAHGGPERLPLRFLELGPPQQRQLEQLVRAVARRVERAMAAQILDDDTELDDDAHPWREEALTEA